MVMKHIKSFEKFAEQDKCDSCGASLNPNKNKCDYCGSHYKVKEEEKEEKSDVKSNVKKNYWEDYQKKHKKPRTNTLRD